MNPGTSPIFQNPQGGFTNVPLAGDGTGWKLAQFPPPEVTTAPAGIPVIIQYA